MGDLIVISYGRKEGRRVKAAYPAQTCGGESADAGFAQAHDRLMQARVLCRKLLERHDSFIEPPYM